MRRTGNFAKKEEIWEFPISSYGLTTGLYFRNNGLSKHLTNKIVRIWTRKILRKKKKYWEFHISNYGLTGYMYDC